MDRVRTNNNEVCVLIESFNHYNFFKKNIKKKNIKYVFYVTNYELNHLLLDRKEKVINILELDNSKLINNSICLKIHELIEYINKYSNNISNEFIEDIEFFKILDRSLKTMLITLVHKYLQFLDVVKNTNIYKNKLYIIGDSSLSKSLSLSTDFNRFENLFLEIAKHYKYKNIKTFDLFDYNNKNLILKNNVDKITKRSSKDVITYWLFNNTSSILYKLHKKFKINVFKYFKFFRKNKKKRILVWGNINYNDIIMNSYLEFQKKGFVFEFKSHKWNNNIFDEIQYKNFKKKYFSLFLNFFSISFENFLKNYFSKNQLDILVYILSKKIQYKFFIYLSNKNQLEKQFFEYNKFFNEYDYIFTNGFFRVEEKLMYNYLKKNENFKNYKIVSFEHGSSYGTDKMHEHLKKSYSMKYADIGVYMTKQSYDIAKKLNLNKEIYFSGFAKIYKNSLVNLVPSIVMKIILGLSPLKKYVMIPMPCENNNYIYGPDYPSDYMINLSIKLIIDDLLNNYPNHIILLKKYPGQRYMDYSKFAYFIKKYKNVKLIDNIEMKILKKITDIIATFYFSSTFGILSSFKKEILVYEFYAGSKIINITKKNISKTDFYKKFCINKNDLYVNWNDKFINNF